MCTCMLTFLSTILTHVHVCKLTPCTCVHVYWSLNHLSLSLSSITQGARLEEEEETGSDERRREEEEKWKEKQLSPQHDEEEPLPPYTEVDPLEKKKQKEQLKKEHKKDDKRVEGHRSITPDSTPNTLTGNPAPQPLPFIRTRSDEPANLLRGAVDAYNLIKVESTSEETLVGSSSHQDLHLAR